MIFFIGNDGTVIKSFPSPVYQGSVNANNIYIIAPFAENLTVTVAFRLPNGIITERFVMTPVNEIAGVTDEKTGKVYSGWQFSLPNTLTKYFGTVKAQFYFYAGNGVLVASSSTDFQVGRGVPDILPEEPSADVYAAILSNISALQQQLNNGAYPARAIYAWNSTYSYGANEITYFPDVGLFGALVKSKAADNLNHPPYNEAGELNSQYWEALLYFTSEGKAAIFWGFNQPADITDLEKAVTFEPIAIDEENVVLPYKEGYYIVATKPFTDGGTTYQPGVYVDMLGTRTQLTMKGEPGEGIDGNGTYPNMTVGTATKAINDEQGNNIANQFGVVTSDIEGLREDILNESHFRGMFTSVEALREAYPTATPNDFAWIVGGNIWIYTNGAWTDSGYPTPANAASLSNATPLMDGTGASGTSTEASRADHRHPSDTSKASVTALNTEAIARQEGDNKNYYNLGAYDTYVSNGDGTQNVPRKTGIRRYSGSDVEKVTAYTYTNIDYFQIQKPEAYGGYNTFSAIPIITNKYVVFNKQGDFDNVNSINTINGQAQKGYFWIGFAKGTTLEQAQQAIDGLIVQYKLASEYQYTEQVIENQPIRFLPLAGELELYEEWRKGLNLINDWAIYDYSGMQFNTTNGNVFVAKITDGDPYFRTKVLNNLPAGTYTLSVSDPSVEIWVWNDTTLINTKNTFVKSSGEESFHIELENFTIGNTYALDLMLVRGSHPYPYEPYNGGIVREKDLESLKQPLFYGLTPSFRENEFGHGLSNTFFNNQFNRLPIVDEEFFVNGDIYDLNNGQTDILNSFFAAYKVTAVGSNQTTARLIDYTLTRGVQGPKGETGDSGATYSLNGTVLTITFNTD